jgi:hypothetical protein
MIDLAPCQACGRHVRADAASCPFCASPITAPRVKRTSVAANVGRAAMFYLGATLASCGGDERNIAQPYGAPPDPPPEEPEGPVIPEETIAQPYGAPPEPPPEELAPIEAVPVQPEPEPEPQRRPRLRREAPDSPSAPAAAYGGAPDPFQ